MTKKIDALVKRFNELTLCPEMPHCAEEPITYHVDDCFADFARVRDHCLSVIAGYGSIPVSKEYIKSWCQLARDCETLQEQHRPLET